MRKSETGSLLPYIKTQRSSLNNKQRMKSVFIERVKQEVSQETSYQVMNSSTIGQQQKKLKQLLRQFNDKSQMILADYISVPAKLTDNIAIPKKSVQHLIKVREQEGNILATMMQQCRNQLKLLQSRCENLKYTNRQEMIKQIHLTKTEIEKLRTENKDIGRQVTLNGLNICRGDRNDLVKELESEKLQIQNKKQQNNTQNIEVLKQIQSTIKKTAELEKEAVNLQAQYRQAINVQHSLLTLQKMKEQAKQKKKLIEQIGTKNEQVNGAIKQRYLTKLRQLQEINNSSKKNSEELTSKQEAILKSRKQLIILEHQLSALKSGVTTIKLLESHKKKN